MKKPKPKALLVYRKINSFGDLEVCLLVNSSKGLLNLYCEAEEGSHSSIDSSLKAFQLVNNERELLK